MIIFVGNVDNMRDAILVLSQATQQLGSTIGLLNHV